MALNTPAGWKGTWVCEADKHKAMDMYLVCTKQPSAHADQVSHRNCWGSRLTLLSMLAPLQEWKTGKKAAAHDHHH
jgi:hypothetical protein